jgi:hypothetical protein
VVAVLCVATLGGVTAGCGSSSSNSVTTEPSTEFTGTTGNNRPASFGQVASDEERAAASKVLEENLEARASGDWAAQCATLTADKTSQAEIYAPGEGCAAGLGAEVKRFSVSRSSLANTMTGPIAVLRVEGNFGYALYHGKKGQDYAMLMKKEGGEWKVAHLATNEVP